MCCDALDRVIPDSEPTLLQARSGCSPAVLAQVVQTKRRALCLGDCLDHSLWQGGEPAGHHGLQCRVLLFIRHGPEGMAQALGRHLGKAPPSQRLRHKGALCACKECVGSARAVTELWGFFLSFQGKNKEQPKDREKEKETKEPKERWKEINRHQLVPGVFSSCTSCSLCAKPLVNKSALQCLSEYGSGPAWLQSAPLWPWHSPAQSSLLDCFTFLLAWLHPAPCLAWLFLQIVKMSSESCLAIVYPPFLRPLNHSLPLSPKDDSRSTFPLPTFIFPPQSSALPKQIPLLPEGSWIL